MKLSTFTGITCQLSPEFAFGKSIIAKFSKKYGWKSFHKGIFVYENDADRHMMSSVIEFNKKSEDENNDNWYISDIKRIIKKMPIYCSYKEASNDESIKNDLNNIISYRKEFQKEFKS